MMRINFLLSSGAREIRRGKQSSQEDKHVSDFQFSLLGGFGGEKNPGKMAKQI